MAQSCNVILAADALADATEALKLEPSSSRAQERTASAFFKLGLSHVAIAAQADSTSPLPGAAQVSAALNKACTALPAGALQLPTPLFALDFPGKEHLDDVLAATGAALGSVPDSFVLRSAHAAVLAASGRLALAAQHALHACATVLRNKAVWASGTAWPAPLLPEADASLPAAAAAFARDLYLPQTPFLLLALLLTAGGHFDGATTVIAHGRTVTGGADGSAVAAAASDSETPLDTLASAVAACEDSKSKADAQYKGGHFDDALAAYQAAASAVAEATGVQPVTLSTNAAAAAAASGGVQNAPKSAKLALEALKTHPYLAKAWQRLGAGRQSEASVSSTAQAFAAYGAAQQLQPSNVAVSTALQPLHKSISSDPVAHINSDEEWAALIQKLKSTGVKRILVDYFAVWCGPCKAIAPYVSELASAYHPGTLTFAKVDGDKCQDLIMEAGVRAFPTFHVYDVASGRKVDELQGAAQAELQKLAYRAALGGAASAVGGHLSAVPSEDMAANIALAELPSKAVAWLKDANAETAVTMKALSVAFAAAQG